MATPVSVAEKPGTFCWAVSQIPKTATALLEFFIKRESTVSLMRQPLSHFCQEEVVLHAQECLLKLNKQVITYQDVRDMVENLVGLHNMCVKKNSEVAKELGITVRKLVIIVGEVATSLEKISEVPITDWMAIGDAIVDKLEKLNLPKSPPFGAYIPRMRDFKSMKMLGAGGFGAVYMANYRPANFVSSLKLVNVDRFSRHKQAAMDKVVASVIRNPFLVKYYCCFCVKEAYVTIMEYIAGVDLMRVVTKEEYLDLEPVKVIMAQLILALEHMHLRGFLHRDIKVSNMMISPGGRVKVIDFDTTKVCNGHCRAADWWSAGIVMYKLMTGRVPFRGKTKQLLRERIITAPLKWPRAVEHPHSANVPAKDMTYRMLKKNPLERLGSRSYSDLKTHPFFDNFNWKMLYEKRELCDIPSIKDIMNNDAEKDLKSGDPEDKRKHLQIEEMTDVTAESQKPLLCYAAPSFKKLMTKVVTKGTPADLSKVLPLDFILHVNGIPVAGATLPRIKKMITAAGDQMVLSVMAVSPYRLLTSRRDMLSIMRGLTRETAVINAPALGCFGAKPYGVGIIDVDVSDDKYKTGVKCFVILYADVASASDKKIFPGDVLVEINGASVEGMSRSQVDRLLNCGKPAISLSVVPLSPMRKKRLIISRYQETLMTDTRVPSRSTAADID
ncbi:hypothetical protein HPB48_018725 [Haemaphysalis longicornis]|uniref:Serine/threonine-protein kinase greatwall n=1 Tax=Haemaphysalis longicornis TaxID=44386 RepID=A0A9J6G9Q9_HAELO|nr:hypothetical protein HPB48_018725 [Haemaphysalis longicornis]